MPGNWWDTVQIRGPSGRTIRRSLLVDTGSTYSVLPIADGEALGLPREGSDTVSTSGGPTEWVRSSATFSIGGGTPKQVPVWLSDQPNYQLGKDAMLALGYKVTGPPGSSVSGQAIAEPSTPQGRLALCRGCDHYLRRVSSGAETCALRGRSIQEQARENECPTDQFGSG